MKYITISTQFINEEGNILYDNDSFGLMSINYFNHFKGLRKLVLSSILNEKSKLLGLETIALNEEELLLLRENLVKDITKRLVKLKEKPLSGFGNQYEFKGEEIKLTNLPRFQEENVTSKLINFYDFCERCIKRKRTVVINVTDGIPKRPTLPT